MKMQILAGFSMLLSTTAIALGSAPMTKASRALAVLAQAGLKDDGQQNQKEDGQRNQKDDGQQGQNHDGDN